MNKNITVSPRYDADRAFENRFPWEPPTPTGFYASLRELVTNSHDEGATSIELIIEHGKLFAVLDNGGGFGSDQRNGFLWVDDSVKRGKDKMTGQHGTGRTRTVCFAHSLTAISVPPDHPDLFLEFAFKRAYLKQIIGGNAKDGEWIVTRKPKWWTLPKGKTGTAMVLDIPPEHWKAIPTPAKIIEHLAEQLHPSVAKIIRVNGKKLKARATFGRDISREFSIEEIAAVLGQHTAEKLGTITVDLFQPEVFKRSDELSLGGATNKVLTLHTFLHGVRNEDLVASVPKVLVKAPGQGQVGGVIFIPGLNKYVAENRNSLKSSVYDGFDTMVIAFLSQVLGPVLDAEFQRQQDESLRAKQRARLLTFANSIRNVFGAPKNVPRRLLGGGAEMPQECEKGKKVDTRALVVSPAYVEALPGDPTVIEVVRFAGPDDDLIWNASGVKTFGDISSFVGRQVTFSGQEIGEGTLVVCSKTDPAISAAVDIAVVDAVELSISPKRIPIPQGGDRRFRARNHKSTSGKLRWRLLDEAKGLTLRNTVGLETFVQTSETCPLGCYRLECYDGHNKHINAQATVEVTVGFNPVIEIDGVKYRLATANAGQQHIAVLERGQMGSDASKPDEGIIEINFSHSDFKHLHALSDSTVASDLLLMESVYMAHFGELVRRDEMEPGDVWATLQARRSKYLAGHSKSVPVR